MDKIFRRLEEDPDSPSSDEGIKSDQLKAIQTPQKGHGVTPGRPGGIKPLHPTRTPTQFSQKPGPKLKPYNSLLPALSPIKLVNFSPKKKSPKKKVLLDNINHYQPDEQQMLELNYSCWDSKSYMLRQDEIGDMVDVLNSINTGISGSTLVIPDTYAFLATQALQLDWTQTDEFPVSPAGKKVFDEDSIMGQFWSLSQQADFDQCLVFHHQINHWFVFKKTFDDFQSSLVCYEPFKGHGRQFDVQELAFLAEFFNPRRDDHMPKMKVIKDYTLICLDLQKDGASCGFWVATFSLLTVSQIDPSSTASKKVLNKLGAAGLKTLWKAIMTSYLQDSDGLQTSVLNDFLAMFSDWNVGKISICILVLAAADGLLSADQSLREDISAPSPTI